MKLLRLNIIIAICLLCAGCLSVSYPKRQQYMLNVHPAARITRPAKNTILNIDDASIAPQFAGNTFVYRTTNARYLTDYYNLFFIPPAQQISQLLMKYLMKTGIYEHIDTPDSLLKANYILNTNILALYADYRHSANPKAVVSIQFTYYHIDKNNTPKLVFDKVFTQAIPLKAKDSFSLIYGWNKGIQRIFYQVSRDLKQKTV